MFERTTNGEWVVFVLSIIFALITIISTSTEQSGAYFIGAFIGTFILSLIVLYIIYWIITKVYPKSRYWDFIPWILAILGIPFILIFVAAYVLGMVGSTYNIPSTFSTSSYIPVSTTASTIITQSSICNEWSKCGFGYGNFEGEPVGLSQTCHELYQMRMQNDQRVLACLKNPYEAKASTSREVLQCLQGVGPLEYCYSIADKNGISHTYMKQRWCETNSGC
jgi:hypothetical protein